MTSLDRAFTRHPLRRTAERFIRPGVSAVGWGFLILALAGCMAPRPGEDLPPFGDSVRHTKALQTYEPGDEVPPLQGAKAVDAMRVYRLPASGGGEAPSSTP
ncbi:hypothetical protein LL947_13495 [Halomonas sp. BLK-85]